MTDAAQLCELIVFLAVACLSVTGAWLWFRYGYDGVRFLISEAFDQALLEWKIGQTEGAALQSKRLEKGETDV